MQHMLSEFANYMPEDCIEQYSIDECFLDISPVVSNYFEAVRFACKIKKLVRDLERLTVSIGLSFNKTWAKMATKFQKPDGLTVLREENREDVYKLPASKIWGVGSRIERRLKTMGIFTIGELANSNIHAIHKEFGINGVILRKLARGEDTSVASKQAEQQAKSFNHHHTLTEPIYEPREVEDEIRRMVEYVSRKLRRRNLVTRYFILTIRYDDLGFVSEKVRLSFYTSDERELFGVAIYLYKKFPKPCVTRKARMFGVTVFDLHRDGGTNLDLFRKYLRFPFREMDYLKEKYGERIIRIGLDRL
jgi:nucleotidyltransferase/DNA polymerase involved in DNA repair